MDLPGKENIVKTFVDLDDEFNIYQDPIQNKILRASLFLDPMYLPILDFSFADLIITFVRNNYKRIYNSWERNAEYVSVKKSGKRVDNNFTDYKDPNNENNHMNRISVGDFSSSRDNIQIQYTAVELMKFLIENSHFNILEGIIENIYLSLSEFSPENIKKLRDLASGAYEGIYINENILGIITYIIKDVMKKDGKKFIETQVDPNIKLLDDINSEYSTNPLNTTLEAVTFKFRKLLREQNEMNFETDGRVYSRFDGINHGYTSQDYLEEKLKQIEKSYDYSKTYNYDNPLIATVLKPYLDKLENYYMFYLLTNNDPDFKCEKQMKLLDVSLKFIQAMNPKL
jgi:uncharacterized protein YqgV (UPF0045/DUF77 family)